MPGEQIETKTKARMAVTRKRTLQNCDGFAIERDRKLSRVEEKKTHFNTRAPLFITAN